MRRGFDEDEPKEKRVTAAELDREWVEFLTGQPHPPGRGVPSQVSEATYTERTIRRLGEQGLKRILWTARNGPLKDALKAAIYLVDRCMGAPDKPFAERVEAMTEDEAQRELLETYVAMGLAEPVAREMVAAFVQNAGGR